MGKLQTRLHQNYEILLSKDIRLKKIKPKTRRKYFKIPYMIRDFHLN